MEINDIEENLDPRVFSILSKTIKTLRPAQEKSINVGLFDGNNLLVCTPTASGKTFVAELAATKTILKDTRMVVYIVPLKALAQEKYKDFSLRYTSLFKVVMSIGDLDSNEERLGDSDLLITTSEKLDSLIRHHTPWLSRVGLVVIDEIHLLNDVSRGPTLEILITILRRILKNVQIIGLSATIGNASELAKWLNAELVEDTWRPVRLDKGIYSEGKIEFFDK